MKKSENSLGTLAKVGVGLLVAVGLIILAKAASAGNVAGASALQKNSTNANTSGLGIQLVTGADFNGDTSNGLKVNGSLSISGLPTPTPGIQPVSPTVSTNWKTSGTLTVTTHTSQCLNLTSAAGVSTYLNFHARAVRGGTSVVADAATGVTYSTIVESLNGPMEFVTGASDKIYGPCFEPGTIIPMKASGTASVTLGYMLTQCK